MKSLIATILFLGTVCLSARANIIDVYASTFPNSYPTLESIDLNTGNVTPLATINWGGIVNDVAVNPINGNIYGISGANLFEIGQNGNVVQVVSSGLNSGMESLAFNSNGNLYIANQSSLYSYSFSSPYTGSASYLGDYNTPGLSGTGQNIRFNGNQLYVTDTEHTGNSGLYSVSLVNGQATFVGIITNEPSIALGNNGSQLLGSSVPAINNGNAKEDLLSFGSTVTTFVQNGQSIVNYEVVSQVFPENVNFSNAGNVEAVPEPSTYILFGIGLVGIFAIKKNKGRV